MRLWSNGSVARGNGGFNPEKRLLAAVLQRAITDFLTGDGEVQLSAKEWLFSDDECSETFCFPYICEALDFNIGELRKAVSRQYNNQFVTEKLPEKPVAEPSHVEAMPVRIPTSGMTPAPRINNDLRDFVPSQIAASQLSSIPKEISISQAA